MRVLITIAIISVVCFFMPGCSKSSSTSSAQADSAYVKATIQGLAFAATGQNAAYAGSSSSGGINYLYIYGVATNGQAVSITLVNNPGIGITQLASGGGSADYYPSGGLQGSYTYATSGSVTISALTPNLKGTFSFVTSDNKTVAGGSFSVPAP